MTRIFLCLLLTLGASFRVFSQKSTEVRDQTWLAYFNQTRFTKRSGIWTDLQFRLTDHFVEKKSIFIYRLAYTYHLYENLRFTAGYSYSLSYGDINVPEHDVWEQVWWAEQKNRLNISQWLRLEERFKENDDAGKLTGTYTFSWRFRYSITLQFPLKGKSVVAKTPFIFVNNELLINAGKNIVNNYFDQNRFGLGLGYQFTPGLSMQLGYLDVFEELPDGNKFVNINAVRVFFFHNLDLRKKS